MSRRRAVSLLLCALLLFGLLPLSARAAEEKLTFHFEVFPDLRAVPPQGRQKPVTADQDPYADMKRQVVEGIRRVYFAGGGPFEITNTSGGTITGAIAGTVYYNALYDNPEQTYFAAIGVSYDREATYLPGQTIRFLPVFPGGMDDEDFRDAVDEACRTCFGSADGVNDAMTDYEKVTAAHDYLAVHCRYDPCVGHGVLEYTTPGGTVFREDRRVYTAYGALVNQRAACQGYALAFKILMDRAGVACCFVNSEATCHTWNLVRIDGIWYHADPTWADPIYDAWGDFSGRLHRGYYLYSDAELPLHETWSTEFGCTCPTSYPVSGTLRDSPTAVWYWGGRLFHVTAAGQLDVYLPGGNLKTPVSSWDIGCANGPGGTVLDAASGILYVRELWSPRILTVNLGDLTLGPVYAAEERSMGVGLTRVNGLRTLYAEVQYDRTNVWQLQWPTPLTIRTHPADTVGAVGGTAVFTVAAGGDRLHYQWQYKTPRSADWKPCTVAGCRTAALSIPVKAARDGYQYRCVVTDRYGGSVTTAPAALRVTPSITIRSQPKDVTARAGQTARFSVSAEGEGLRYQWQYCRAGETEWHKSAAEGSGTAALSIRATEARSGLRYRCVITAADGTRVTTDAATLTVTG